MLVFEWRQAVERLSNFILVFLMNAHTHTLHYASVKMIDDREAFPGGLLGHATIDVFIQLQVQQQICLYER